MAAQAIKGKPITATITGKVFKASERAEFFAALERIKAAGLTGEARIQLGNGGEFTGAILAVVCGGIQ